MKARIFWIPYSIIISIVLISSLYLCKITMFDVIHQSSNNYGDIWVYEDILRQNRYLSFAPPNRGYEQSGMIINNPDYIKHDYTKLMLSALYINKNPSKILLIGFGAGSLARAINNLLPDSELDIVEINPALPQIAVDYFQYYGNRNTNIYIADGVEFIKNHGEYDMIFIDAFDEKYIPKEFLSQGFMKNLKKALNSNGIVSMNSFVNNQYEQLEDILFNKTFDSFINLQTAKDYGNRIRLAIHSKFKPQIKQVKENAEYWKEKFAKLNIEDKFLLSRF